MKEVTVAYFSFFQEENLPSTVFDDLQKEAKTKKVNLTDIFTQVADMKLGNVKLYKAGLLGKVQAVSWVKMDDNLPLVLPLPLRKREKKVKKYPLKANDPLLNVTKLWERHSWLSLDDEQDTEPQGQVTQEKEESKEEVKVPQNVKNASKLCLRSLGNLYDSFAQLDIMESSKLIISHPKTQIKDRGWWTHQPTAGLSDEQDCHPHWAPYDGTDDICDELQQRAVAWCTKEISSGLSGIFADAWPELCLPQCSSWKTPNLSSYFSTCDR